jgi:hypothetical protein
LQNASSKNLAIIFCILAVSYIQNKTNITLPRFDARAIDCHELNGPELDTAAIVSMYLFNLFIKF